MTQNRLDSVIEAVSNTAIGFGISMATWIIAAPLSGVQISLRQNLVVTGVFTVVSIARQYMLRRLFNGASPGEAIRRLFVRDCPDCQFADRCQLATAEKTKESGECSFCKGDCGQRGGIE